MISKVNRSNKRFLFPAVLVATLFLIGLAASNSSFAATPSEGSVSPGAPANWSGITFGAAVDTTTCVYGANCDAFKLTVNNPGNYDLLARIEWALPANDLDLYLCRGTDASPCDTLLASSGQSATTYEQINYQSPAPGVYYLVVVNFAGSTTYNGVASLSQPPAPSPTPTPPPGVIPPRYANYAPPFGLGTNAGEPSIGVNWNTGNVMFGSGLQTLRVDFNPTCTLPTWEDVSPPTNITSLDPILFTDHATGRTFVSQLTGQDSLSSYSDDDGNSWIPSQGGGVPSGVDHQTIGGGPYAPGLGLPVPGQPYTNAVYYCSQELVTAFCARSDTGGLTYGAGVPIYTVADGCGGIHGHVKVAPDGTVYVPNKNCNGSPAVSVSTDNGITWAVQHVPGANPTARLVDPSVGIGANGTVYMAYQSADGHMHAVVSRNRGASWTNDQDLGAQFGLQNTTFPEVVSGDDDRAAVAFLGTPTGGDYEDYQNFRGVWHLYISTSYDGGQSWTTVDATPNDPVQRGSICNEGTTTCGSNGRQDRNLLDFMDITIDHDGRVLVGYPDGCIGGCVNDFPNSFSSVGTIARQTGGKRLLAAYDPPAGQTAPQAPILSATRQSSSPTVRLTWTTPDNGGTAITSYNIYRGTTPGGETAFATISGTTTTYDDTTADPNVTYYYQVSAVNNVGEGTRSCEISPVTVPVQNPCQLPGALATEDSSDSLPNVPPDSSVDIKQLYVAEPYFPDGSSKLVFTLKVAGGPAPQSSQWYILWNRLNPDANADRNYVAMKSAAPGSVSFEYGTISPPNVNAPTRIGDADSGTYDPSTGTVTITISNSKVEDIHAGQSLTALQVRTFYTRVDGGPVTQTASSDYSPEGAYTLIGNGACRPGQPDLTITNITASQSRPGQTTLTAAVSNAGNADATGVVVRFNDGTGLIADSASVDIASRASANVSIVWNTRSLNGDHVITAIADPNNTVAESNENNNQAQRTITIRGNKVSNGSLEQSSGSAPSNWSSSQGTAYDANSANATDGTHSVSATGNGGPASLLNPGWTSAPVNVTAGQTYNLAMTVKAQGLSSAPALQVVYLDGLGQVVNTVTGITTNITGNANAQQVLGQITIPQGVAQVRLELKGFSLTDLTTRGTVWFDDVWLW